MIEPGKECGLPFQATTNLERVVPKFCTGINLSLMGSGNVIFTMTYSEGDSKGVVIERIVIDLEHARSLSVVLADVLSKAMGEKNADN